MKTDTTRKFENVCQILDKYQRDSSKLIPVLQEVQHVYRYLPEEVLAFIATGLGLSPAKVYGVASFYANFSLEPKGKYVVHVCDGTACHVKGSGLIKDALFKKLGLSSDKKTTQDMLFTVETVSCLGACGLAPVITINDKVYGQVTPDKAVSLIDAIIAEETNA
jgi:NADH-quinone oxidoreductase subunit E